MRWINHEDELKKICQSWLAQPLIALDTEFERSTTFYPTLALLQVADHSYVDNQYLIDALALPQLSAHFSQILRSPTIKLFHSGHEDLEIFSYWPDADKINAVVDTQILAAYAGLGSQVSYQSLVKQLLNIDIDKTQTRTNWLQRPLTNEQIFYAADDVKYLLPCYEILYEKLKQKNYLDWALEDCQGLEKITQCILPENYYLTLSSAYFFNMRQLSVLKFLCEWREKYIRKNNIPRSFIAKDGALLAIAEKIPLTHLELKQFLDYKSRPFHIEEEMIFIINQALESLNKGNIPSGIAQPISAQKKFKPVLRKLKDAAAEIAQQLDLPDVLILKQRWIDQLVSVLLSSACDKRKEELPSQLQGWRYQYVVQPLQSILNQWNTGEL